METIKLWIARDTDGVAFVHFRRPILHGDGVFRSGGDTMICRLAPEENLFPDIKPGVCVEFKAKKSDIHKREELEKFSIVDFCLENHRDSTGAVYLADAFKDLHDRYGCKYADIHDKFKREVESRADVYITRTSDIWIKGAERKRLPLYHNQWYSHLMTIK